MKISLGTFSPLFKTHPKGTENKILDYCCQKHTGNRLGKAIGQNNVKSKRTQMHMRRSLHRRGRNIKVNRLNKYILGVLKEKMRDMASICL